MFKGGLVHVQEVYRCNQYYQKDWKLSFWRTSHGAEVDLILERGRRLLCAIEIKFKKSFSSKDLSGLKSFSELHPQVPQYVVAPIDVSQKLGPISLHSPQKLLALLLEEF